MPLIPHISVLESENRAGFVENLCKEKAAAQMDFGGFSIFIKPVFYGDDRHNGF